jgi:protein-glucosylgalactosylhydroxylysine glucosidase
MTRRELLQYSIATPLVTPLIASTGAGKLDRQKVVKRNDPSVSTFAPGSSLSVGNGSFVFTVDCTGLQTAPEVYSKGAGLTTQTEWAWHTQPNPSGFRYEDTFEEYTTRAGRKVRYPSKATTPAGRWYRENPYKRGLTRIGFFSPAGPVAVSEIDNIQQRLELCDGVIRSTFRWKGQRVETLTAAHPTRDAVAVRITSPALASGELRVRFAFPYTSSSYPAVKGSFGEGGAEKPANENWTVEAVSRQPGHLIVKHSADADAYFAAIHYGSNAAVEAVDGQEFVLTAHDETLEFTVEFTPAAPAGPPVEVAATLKAASNHWNAFWSTGGCLDLSGSTDPRAGELERNAVLSQYLTAIQCSGAIPPQESGLSGNNWYGKFHGEMHWWHSAHFPMWGRPELLERSTAWYRQIMPRAKAYAAMQGYRGARWPKECGPEGRSNPWIGSGPFLIWQQPHLIYFAEQLYKAKPSPATLRLYAEIVHESAEFMASYAEWDAQEGRYFLGPPMCPAQETYDQRVTFNSTYELSYWSWGLKLAQKWRERQKLARVPEWDRVIQHLSPLPVHDGLYIGAESQPDFWQVNRKDHPSFLAAYGVLPGDMVDRETMRRTFHKTLDAWPWDGGWGWDCGMAAMTATRLGEPEMAVECLLRDTAKNHFSANGHSTSFEPCYLPANGSLLAALAIMTTGWEGGQSHAPGFPAKGKWQVKAEGLRPML